MKTALPVAWALRPTLLKTASSKGQPTWPDYLRSLHDISQSYASRVIQAAVIYEAVKGVPNGIPLPACESHCRALAYVVCTST